jgi:hypothetical protein
LGKRLPRRNVVTRPKGPLAQRRAHASS